MTITQTVEIPADNRILIELPRSVPSGVMARVKIDIPDVSVIQSPHEIEEIRLLLKKEMAEKRTSEVATASGDGWEAYVRERHAEL